MLRMSELQLYHWTAVGMVVVTLVAMFVIGLF